MARTKQRKRKRASEEPSEGKRAAEDESVSSGEGQPGALIRCGEYQNLHVRDGFSWSAVWWAPWRAGEGENPIPPQWRTPASPVRSLDDDKKKLLTRLMWQLHAGTEAMKDLMGRMDGGRLDNDLQPQPQWTDDELVAFWTPWRAGEAWNPVPPPFRTWWLTEHQKILVARPIAEMTSGLIRAKATLVQAAEMYCDRTLATAADVSKKHIYRGQLGP